MKTTALAFVGILLFALSRAKGHDGDSPSHVLYANPGNTMAGFVLKYGNLSFSVKDGVLVGASGSGWYALPVLLKGNFQIDVDVYGDSGDVDSNILLVDDLNNEGIELNNCPQDTDTPTIAIKSSTHLADYQGYFFDQTLLVNAPSSKFPNGAWTHITITRKGDVLTDNVGGQSISTTVSRDKFPAEARLGLGYYATTNLGGNGQIRYAHLRVIQLSDEAAGSVSLPGKVTAPAPDPRQQWD